MSHSTRELLIETFAFTPPAQALEGLDAKDAERRLTGSPHSISEIVAHMVFWQEWFVSRTRGEARPLAARAVDGWPGVEPASWEGVRGRFLSGLETLVAIGDGAEAAQLVSPALDPPFAHFSVLDAVHHAGQHNAHHLGQIILLRQLMGRWPPPSGGLTW